MNNLFRQHFIRKSMQYSLRHPPFHQMDTQNEKEMLLRSCLPNEKKDMYENGKKERRSERKAEKNPIKF